MFCHAYTGYLKHKLKQTTQKEVSSFIFMWSCEPRTCGTNMLISGYVNTSIRQRWRGKGQPVGFSHSDSNTHNWISRDNTSVFVRWHLFWGTVEPNKHSHWLIKGTAGNGNKHVSQHGPEEEGRGSGFHSFTFVSPFNVKHKTCVQCSPLHCFVNLDQLWISWNLPSIYSSVPVEARPSNACLIPGRLCWISQWQQQQQPLNIGYSHAV